VRTKDEITAQAITKSDEPGSESVSKVASGERPRESEGAPSATEVSHTLKDGGPSVPQMTRRKTRQVTSMGCLIVIVHKATQLPAADLGGKSDPYVELRCGSSQMQKTWVKPKTLDPIWEQQFEFSISDAKAESLEILVKDQDMIQDELLGKANIPLPEPGTRLQDHAFELEVPKALQRKDIKPTIRLTLSLKRI